MILDTIRTEEVFSKYRILCDSTETAYDSMLCLLREMLVLEGRDKEFLLNSIARVTESCKFCNFLTSEATLAQF